MRIVIRNKQKDLPIYSPQVRIVVKAFLEFEKCMCDELSVFFVKENEIARLHQKYFDDPSVTDCITFPMDEEEADGYRFLGDIFVCPKTAANYVALNGGDVYEEITLYVIHGLLHLIGYNDIDPKDKQAMRRAEKRHMNQLKAKDLLLTNPQGGI